MNNTERFRKRLTLLLIGLVAVLTLFVGTTGYEVDILQEWVYKTALRARQAEEDYLALAIRINLGFIDTVAQSWESHNDGLCFKEEYIAPMTTSAYHSIIFFGGDTYYAREEVYGGRTFDVDHIPLDCTTHILYGDPGIHFGQGERLFIAGMMLGDQPLYIGFDEQAMYNNFISSLDVESLEGIQTQLQVVGSAVQKLMLFIIFYGVVLLYYVRRLQMEIYKDIVKEMGSEDGREV